MQNVFPLAASSHIGHTLSLADSAINVLTKSDVARLRSMMVSNGLQSSVGIPQTKNSVVGKTLCLVHLPIAPAILAIYILIHIGCNHTVVECRVNALIVFTVSFHFNFAELFVPKCNSVILSFFKIERWAARLLNFYAHLQYSQPKFPLAHKSLLLLRFQTEHTLSANCRSRAYRHC